MNRLENVVGVVGGLAALVGCFIPLATRGGEPLGVGDGGGVATVLYLCAGIGLLVSLIALVGKMTSEEWVQILAGVVGLVVTWLVHRGFDGASAALGLHLLYWGFALLIAEGLIHFDDRRVGLPAAD